MQRNGARIAIFGVALIVLIPLVLIMGFLSMDANNDGVDDYAGAGVGGALRPGAPVPAQWVPWVSRAGTLCTDITPAEVAAQIDVESGWNPNATAYNPASHGGDAMGLAQFQQGTWNTWGRDFDGDGMNSPYDPEDAIMGLATLMCDLVKWAHAELGDGAVHGDPLDIALAAYNCGRGCVQGAGGVPAAGQAHDYPQKVRAKIPLYAASPVVPSGSWMVPLARGKYVVGSPFGPRAGGFHYGVDLIANRGTPILAASAGVVARVVCDASTIAAVGSCDVDGSTSAAGCGWFVEIRHAGNVTTRYCHQLVHPYVAVGQQIAEGQQIGIVGTSGHSSGPHCHFEVHTGFPANNQNAIDPIAFLRSVGVNP